MPDLSTDLHVKMLKTYRRALIGVSEAVRRGYAKRDRIDQDIKAGSLETTPGDNGKALVRITDLEAFYGKPRSAIYGMRWGDPETVPPLAYVKNNYMMPHVRPEHTGLEIGPGGGRWTQYLLAMKKLYVVDYYKELLETVVGQLDAPNMVPIHNNGSDFPGVPDEEIDFLFTFGVFVHLEPHIIESYLLNMKRILKPDARVLLHYSDKTKIMAKVNDTFVDTNADSMRRMVSDAGYAIVSEDNTSLWHSNVMIFRLGT